VIAEILEELCCQRYDFTLWLTLYVTSVLFQQKPCSYIAQKSNCKLYGAKMRATNFSPLNFVERCWGKSPSLVWQGWHHNGNGWLGASRSVEVQVQVSSSYYIQLAVHGWIVACWSKKKNTCMLFLHIFKKSVDNSAPLFSNSTFIMLMIFFFRYWPNNKSRMYIMENTGMRNSLQ
jgi:hypothetical protein